jgi:hypothetical protein
MRAVIAGPSLPAVAARRCESCAASARQRALAFVTSARRAARSCSMRSSCASSASSWAAFALQLGGRDAVLARQLLDRRQALLDELLPRRVDVEVVEVARELAGRLADADQRLVDQRQHRGEARVECAALAQQGERAAGRGMCVAVLGLVEQAERGARGLGEPTAIG